MRKSNRELFDDLAESYDSVYSRNVDLKENRYIYAKLKKLLAGRSVMDLGCGTATILNYIPIKSYIGTDISWNMIKKAIINFEREDDQRSFYVEDIDRSMKLRNAEVIISMFGVINHLHNHIPMKPETFYFLMGWTKKNRPDSPGHNLILQESEYYFYATKDLYPELKCEGFNSIPDKIAERLPYWLCKLWWDMENFFIKDKTKFFHLIYYGEITTA